MLNSGDSAGSAGGAWKARPFEESVKAALVAAGHSPMLAHLLAVRGVDAAHAAEYLDPLSAPLPDPHDLPGVAAAVETIGQYVRERRRIVVFGDYDCDGVCATAILVRTLKALGANVEPFLPRRLQEGYGMTAGSVGRMLREIPDVALVITVDNGINSVAEVAALRERGVATVVTDHHLPGEQLPDCLVVATKVAAPAGLSGLCGAGIAFLIAHALVNRARARGAYDGPKLAGELFVLAGMATVVDIVPLAAANRKLVAQALRLFARCAPAGLRELLVRAARTGAERMTARDFGFLLGPRINAVGRLADGMEALELVLETDREEARARAMKINDYNRRRKDEEKAMFESAWAQVDLAADAQIIALDEGEPGIAGIVAARVLERLGATGGALAGPVGVIVGGHGSARAPEGYNLREALAECSDLLDRFGGHAAAGGFAVVPGRVCEFRRRFAAACARQRREHALAARPPRYYDLEVAAGWLTVDFVAGLARLEPFGEGNPEPVFAVSGMQLSKVSALGNEGRHLSIELRDEMPNRRAIRAVWWGHGDKLAELRQCGSVDVLFTPEISHYGETHVEWRLVDLRPHQPL